MANIKDLKVKIKSTKSTLKITSAMKLVSAAKMARAQQAITSTRPYANELEDTIKVVSALVKDYSHEYLEDNGCDKSLLLVISANKGLCGGYNSQLAKVVSNFAAETENLEVRFIGKKVRDVISKNLENPGKTYEFDKAEPGYGEIEDIANELATLFHKGEFGKIYVAYNIFHSAISFTPTVKQVLPMALDVAEADQLKEKFPFDFKYDPSPKDILNTLVPQTYTTTIWTCMLDALAAEHGSRMSAMDSASGNCEDAIKNLTIKMNKLRQAAITTELTEIVSGAESLNG